ncbi:MAG: signal peptide peptidase SppA [Patescibacteria group bacterium]
MIQKLKKIFIRPIFKFKINYSKFNPKKYNWEKIKFFLKMFIIVITAVFMVLLTIDLITSDFITNNEENEQFVLDISDNIISYLDENNFTAEDKTNDCNTINIKLRGTLTTYIPNEDLEYLSCENGNLTVDETSSENIIASIKRAEENDNIKAVILDIDSTGGSAVAAEEIANALKRAQKPTVAIIREYGDSGAYYAATGADIIFASAKSDIGGIGVTSSYLDNVKKNQKDGFTYNQLSAGKFKDMYNPDKVLTTEEKELIMRDIEIIYEEFIKAVASNRNLEIEKVKQLADGSSMLGQMALDNGLIDRIGGMNEVVDYLKEKISAEINICQ